MVLNVRSSIGLQLKGVGGSELCSEMFLPIPLTDSFSTATVSLIVKAELGPQKDTSMIDHKVGLIYETFKYKSFKLSLCGNKVFKLFF